MFCVLPWATPPLAVCASSGPGRSLWLSGAAESPWPQSSGVSPCAPLQPSRTISQIYAGPPSYARTLLQAHRGAFKKEQKKHFGSETFRLCTRVKVSHQQPDVNSSVAPLVLFCRHHKINNCLTVTSSTETSTGEIWVLQPAPFPVSISST